MKTTTAFVVAVHDKKGEVTLGLKSESRVMDQQYTVSRNGIDPKPPTDGVSRLLLLKAADVASRKT